MTVICLGSSINRNILECKAVPDRECARSSEVLIETYWNVKFVIASIIGILPPVLIETYWNVKTVSIAAKAAPARINRNILECKGKTQSTKKPGQPWY